uniref:Uncharacterized protein n=1 Tax=viral metagenome TaxID=1070528 RepID=A0A6C0CEU9_9ZZZZ
MDSKEFCNNVVTIPQFIGTCWFNAILMAILYSQNSRKLLLHDNIYKKNKDKNIFYDVINDILLNNYLSREKAMEYYKLLKPEVIIKKYLTDLDKMNKKYMLKRGWFFYMYLPKFLKLLGKTSMTLDRFQENDYYINLIKTTEFYKKSLVGNNVEIKLLPNYKELLEIKSNPDYLLVNCFTVDFIGSAFQAMVRNIDKTHDVTSESIKLSNSKKQFKGLDKFEDVIEYNGDKYILDSCILSNYNNTTSRHAIAGISCKNNRYVYNGWMRTTFDPAIVDKNLFIHERMPCELMKFNWDVKNPKSKFCLNPRICQLKNLDKTDNNNQCFSFGKGVRTIIYVKMNKDYKSLELNRSSGKSDIKKVVKTDIKKPKECPDGKVLNPLTGRCIKIKSVVKNDDKKTDKKPKECPDGKVLNPLTGRCIKIKTVVKKDDKKPKECPEGKVLNPLTGRCIKIKTVVKKDVKKPKECPEGKVINPKTGRCIKIKKVNK